MRAAIVCVAVTVILVSVGLWVLAQEVVPTPDPVGGAKIDAGAGVNAGAAAQSGPATNATAGRAKDAWRYRWLNGRWWYWTPQNRWMWYSDEGHWVEFDANHSPPAVVQSDDNPAGYGGYYYYPSPGYWTGYYPGVAVGVRPYGNVDVGVGRRVGVEVWGPHGGVRVGRLRVGW